MQSTTAITGGVVVAPGCRKGELRRAGCVSCDHACCPRVLCSPTCRDLLAAAILFLASSSALCFFSLRTLLTTTTRAEHSKSNKMAKMPAETETAVTRTVSVSVLSLNKAAPSRFGSVGGKVGGGDTGNVDVRPTTIESGLKATPTASETAISAATLPLISSA